MRIAVHPDFQSMGYGSRTLELLEDYYLGRVPSIDENVKESVKTVKVDRSSDGCPGMVVDLQCFRMDTLSLCSRNRLRHELIFLRF